MNAFFRILFVIVIVGMGEVHAETRVSAALSSNTMVAGDSVDYVITIEGGDRISAPEQLEVPELEITYRGESRQMQIRNGQTSSSLSLTYLVTGDKPGVYTIPAAEIQSDGKTFQTQPLQLTITEDGHDPDKLDRNSFGFAEIIIHKKTGYVGEMIPVDLRIYVDTRVNWNAEKMPNIAGEGFTKQKMPNPRREQVRHNGKDYDVLVFRTAITPGRAGKLPVGPGEIEIQAQIPDTRRNRPRSPLDDFFSGNPFSTTPVKRVRIKAEVAELEIRSLPAAGQPKDFAGAVGNFQFSADGSPRKLKVGDPITMKLKISGRGNFDRINAPPLADPTGWHPYPASTEFKPEDDLNLSGTKSFELAVIPETRKTTVPLFSFSYFDPTTEKYVTVQNPAIPIEVEGNAVAIKPATPQPSAATPPPITTPAPEPAKPTDIVGLKYDFGAAHDSFAPLHTDRNFLMAQAVPLAMLLVFIGMRLRPNNPGAANTGSMIREKTKLRRTLPGEKSRTRFFEDAARIVQLETALATGIAAGSVDPQTIRSIARLDPAILNETEEIFQRRAELLYAGTGQHADTETVSDAERGKVLATLQQLERAYAKQ